MWAAYQEGAIKKERMPKKGRDAEANSSSEQIWRGVGWALQEIKLQSSGVLRHIVLYWEDWKSTLVMGEGLLVRQERL